MLKAIPGIETVMLTTNGIWLRKFLPDLLEAGLDGVNISLDTLQREKYREITGYDGLEEVLKAVEACVSAGIRTKINVAAAREINETEILDLARLSEKVAGGCTVYRNDADRIRKRVPWTGQPAGA